jgi:hypothetical protein
MADPVLSTFTRFRVREEVRRIIRDPDFPKNDIDKAINSVISTLNILGRYRFHQSYYDVDLIAFQKAYSIPGLIAEEIVLVSPDSADEIPLFKSPELITPYQEGWFVTTGDTPKVYLMWGNQIWFDPIPNTIAAAKTVRIYGYFRLAHLTSDTAIIPLNDSYCISVLAWGAAAELNPNLVIESSGKQSSIGEIYSLNLKSMIKAELWEPAVSHQIMRDPLRWRNLGKMGNIGGVRRG